MWNTLNSHFRREFIWLIVALFLGSVLATGLVVVRAVYAWKLAHAYLVWNLFLAWIPLGFALLAVRHRTNIRRLLIFSALWLLFLPNAPYLVTDLVHLRERPPVPLWFDMVLLQSFIGLGLVLGLISLYKMQWVATMYLGRRGSWTFVLCVIGLTGFGVYLGRVQRWNSWDIIANPLGLFVDIFKHFTPPHRRGAGLFTILYAGFFFIAYTMFYGLTHLKFAIKEETDTTYES